MRNLDVTFGGLALRLEDARYSSIPAARAAVSESHAALVASIRGYFDAGDERVLCFRCYRFERGEPVELELPFSIVARPGFGDDRSGSYEVTLGGLHAGGEQRWSETDALWEPMLDGEQRARVAVELAHWAGGTQYAAVVLDRAVNASTQLAPDGQWHLKAGGSEVICEALSTGSARDRGDRAR